MVRLLLAFILLFALGLEPLLAQSGSACPLQIVDFQVGMTNTTQLQSGMSVGMGVGSGMGMSTTSPMSARTGEQKLIFSLKSKNPSASQTISCIQWESCFLNSKQDMIVKQFKSKKKIKPSKDETIEETIFYDPKMLPADVKVGYRINKIEFDDKSSWENPSKDADSFVFSTANIAK